MDSSVYCEYCKRNISKKDEATHQVNHTILKKEYCYCCNVWIQHKCFQSHLSSTSHFNSQLKTNRMERIREAELPEIGRRV